MQVAEPEFKLPMLPTSRSPFIIGVSVGAGYARCFVKWRHMDISGGSVGLPMKRPEVTLPMRGKGSLNLWVHKKIPRGTDVFLAKTRSGQRGTSYLSLSITSNKPRMTKGASRMATVPCSIYATNTNIRWVKYRNCLLTFSS